jgi:RND family efflux transporter MFP subunit
LSSEDDYPHPGHIDYVNNRVDAQTGTIQVRGVFENTDASLLPGLFARLRAPISVQKEALVVPESAFGIDQQGYYLLVVNEQNQVEYRGVEVGSATTGLRVVQKGIAAGERVIVNGLQRVRPGATVNPQTAEQLAAAKQSQAG